MKLNVYSSADEMVQKFAEHFINVASESITGKGRFVVALSGGSSPKKLHELLASEGYKDRIDWVKCFFFFGDERHVPQTDSESNYLMAKTTLFQPLNISDNQIFAVDTSVEPAASAREYEDQIQQFFDEGEVRFDLVILGLGEDAHTASLFPHTSVLQNSHQGVREVLLQDKQVYRITINAPMINNARNVAFLVYGKAKAKAVKNVIEGKEDTDKFPAQMIKPTDGDLQWFLDEAAASKIKS